MLDEIKRRTARAVRALYDRGTRTFKAGGALGFDTLAALAVLDLKRDFPDVRLELELIAPTQAKGWNEEDAATFDYIRKNADAVRYASPVYSRSTILARNRNLVDGSGSIICYLTKKSGGTAYTVDYAAKSGLKITNVANGGKNAL